MNFKKIWLLSVFSLAVFSLTGCNKPAPELSFEDTLQVHAKQSATFKEVIKFMTDTEHQIQAALKLKMDLNDKTIGKGNLALDATSISENKTKNSEAQIALTLATDGASPASGGMGKINAHINLSTLLKDYQIFFKLADFKLETEQKSMIEMVSGIVEGFKGKWLTINEPEQIELLKNSSNNSLGLWQNEQFYEANPNYYTGVLSTKYEEQPAWKVDFNTDEIKKMMLEVYSLSQSGTLQPSSGNEALLAQQEQMKADFTAMLETLKIENVEAYFVIRSADKVDFILKNADMTMGEMKINLSQEVKNDTTTVQMSLVPTDDQDRVKLKAILEKLKKGHYNIELTAEKVLEDKKTEPLFTLKGFFKASLSAKTFELTPNFELKVSDGPTLSIEADFSAKKIKDHSFEAPKDAQNLQEMIGSLFGGMMGTGMADDVEDLSGAEDLDLPELSTDTGTGVAPARTGHI